MSDYRLTADNRAAWNEVAPEYRRDADAWIERLRRGEKNFCPPELRYLNDLDRWCHRAIHLQCAGGTDTLSLLNLGAREVVGIDLSDQMIEVARYKSEKLGARALWFVADVLNPPIELYGTADLVYTGRGALNWIHDLSKWAASVPRLLKPGGKLYVFEGHPFTCLFQMDAENLVLDPEYKGYFATEPYSSKGWPASYITQPPPLDQQTAKHERYWKMSDYLEAILQSGLKLISFEEHDAPYWQEFPRLRPQDAAKIPHTFSLFAEKPKP